MSQNQTLFGWIARKIVYLATGSLVVIGSMVLYALVDGPLKAMIGSGDFMALFAVYIVCIIFGLNRLHKHIAGH